MKLILRAGFVVFLLVAIVSLIRHFMLDLGLSDSASVVSTSNQGQGIAQEPESQREVLPDIVPDFEAEAESGSWQSVLAAASITQNDPLAPGLLDEWIDFEKLSGDMLWPEIPMRLESVIWRAYQMASTNQQVDLMKQAYAMLDSSNELVRLTGALWMLEKNKSLDAAIMDRLIKDDSAAVPLSVLGWMMDRGSGKEADGLAARWHADRASLDRALSQIADRELNGLALRAGLKLINGYDWPDGEKLSTMSSVAMNQYAPYDARWQAAMLMRNHMDFPEYQALIAGFLKSANNPYRELRRHNFPKNTQDEAFQTAMQMLDARIAGPPELMGQRPVLTKDDADLLFADETSLMIENVAFWLEAVVDHKMADATSDFKNTLMSYLRDLPREELPANQLLSLVRVEARLDRF